jgi:hypothetical protein
MLELDPKYMERLEELAQAIQASDELAQYLEEEEEEFYLRLKEMFEPRIAMLHSEVATNDPLQLVLFEIVLLDPAFEGLYLPRILGFSVLRGEINENYKYTRPQNHFKDVLLTICESSNFDILRKRIGQSIQIGFALSSDIWITNLINSISNKRVRYFLQGQKLDRYRTPATRMVGYKRYQRQFRNDNFQSAEFPTTTGELKILHSPLKHFLYYRIKLKIDNSSITPHLRQFTETEAFQQMPEFLEIMTIYSGYFDREEEDQASLVEQFNKVRQNYPQFTEAFFGFLEQMHHDPLIEVWPEADQRISAVLDKSVKDDLSSYFDLTDQIHSRGYNQDEVQQAVKVFYNQHEGLSPINECLRQTILGYFQRYISNLEETAYADYFEITKLFPVYMNIFANQQFNQDLKELSMAYVRRLLKKYTDKRGKDYQDIKKFVSTTFTDFSFLKDKEVVELFKTRRKKKKPVKS